MECLAGGTLKDLKETIQFGESQIKYMCVISIVGKNFYAFLNECLFCSDLTFFPLNLKGVYF